MIKLTLALDVSFLLPLFQPIVSPVLIIELPDHLAQLMKWVPLQSAHCTSYLSSHGLGTVDVLIKTILQIACR